MRRSFLPRPLLESRPERSRVSKWAEHHSHVEVITTDSEGRKETKRETRHATLFEDWPALDTTAPSQRIELELPGDGPFSYDGSAFGFRWFVVARESLRLRTDPHRSARLQVLP